MKHQRLLDPDKAPEEPLRHVDADTGYTSTAKNLSALLAAARLHRTSNGLPVPDDFAQLVETQICRRNPGACINRDGSPPDTSCVYRGEFLRWEGCVTCGGNVRGKVTACSIHGESTEFSRGLGPTVKTCWSCRERVSALTHEP